MRVDLQDPRRTITPLQTVRTVSQVHCPLLILSRSLSFSHMHTHAHTHTHTYTHTHTHTHTHARTHTYTHTQTHTHTQITGESTRTPAPVVVSLDRIITCYFEKAFLSPSRR